MTDKKRKAKKSKHAQKQTQAQSQSVHIHLDKPKRTKRTTKRKVAETSAPAPTQPVRVSINPMFSFRDMNPPAGYMNFTPLANPQELIGVPPVTGVDYSQMRQQIQPTGQYMRQPVTEQPSAEAENFREIMKFLRERYGESTETLPPLPTLPEPEPKGKGPITTEEVEEEEIPPKMTPDDADKLKKLKKKS
jgi:hypothetical protein